MSSFVVKSRAACAALTLGLMSNVALAQDAATAPAAPTETPAPPPATPAPEVAPVEPAPVAVAPAPAPTPAATPVVEVVAAPVAPPPAAAPAPPAPGIKLTGSFITRYEVRENYDQFVLPARVTESDVTVFRTRIGLASTPIDVGEGEQVVLQVTPQAAGILGSLGGTVADAAFGLHEGYLRIQGASHKFDAGRFEMNYGDSLIIGNLDWNEVGRSFDGLRMRLLPATEKTFVDVFLTQANPNTALAPNPMMPMNPPVSVPIPGEGGRALNNPLGAGDSYFAGVYTSLGAFIDPAMELEPYLLALLLPGTDNVSITNAMGVTTLSDRAPSTLFTLGTRFKHKVDVVDLRAEGGVQIGGLGGAAAVGSDIPEGRSVLAFQIDAEAGVSLLDNKVRIGLEGLYASGDDPETADEVEGWNHLFPTAHKFMGLMDIVGARSNIASGVLHLTAQATPDLKANFDGHFFARPQALNATTDNSGYAGTILDFALSYALGTGLNVRGLYALLLPGEDGYLTVGQAADLDPAHYVEIELRYDLK